MHTYTILVYIFIAFSFKYPATIQSKWCTSSVLNQNIYANISWLMTVIVIQRITFATKSVNWKQNILIYTVFSLI